MGLKLSNVRFMPASRDLRSTGMIGWVSCALDDALELDALALRRTAEGRYRLSFPTRKDNHGIERPYYRPLSNRVRDAIEAQVIAEIGRRGYLQ
jgi:DNA-binding cell septation regulator SpoVG